MSNTAMKVELSKKNDNPFYGLKNCLLLFQNLGKGVVDNSSLDRAYEEVKKDKILREMFFSMLISCGDITARQHNIFKGNKVDSGGNAQREAFLKVLRWLRVTNFKQYVAFLNSHILIEFIGFDCILANRIQTKKGKYTVLKVTQAYDEANNVKALLDYCESVIKGNNPTHKYFLSKFLTRPRTSKRAGHKTIQASTLLVMREKEQFLKALCDRVDFNYVQEKGYINFKGYYEWRKQYNGELESVLFSSKKILEFDEQQFLGWLEKLPATARFRVRCRLLNADNSLKEKCWNKLGTWFLNWEKFKETKQQEERVLTEKVRQGTATETEVKKLEKVKIEAKVTVGAFNFQSEFVNILKGNVDSLKLESFLNKVNLPYNSLVFVDDSGSMTRSYSYTNERYTPFDLATFIATICLTKNPDDTGRNMLGLYSNDCRIFTRATDEYEPVNSILVAKSSKINKPFINPEKDFLYNLNTVRNFCQAQRTGNGTNIDSIPDKLNQWVQNSPDKDLLIENLMNFPVWTFISDGNWNNMRSPEGSINSFMMKCERYFGFKPFIVAIDVAFNSAAQASRFEGIENFMFIPPNPAQIEQFLVNFKVMDIMDVYTPLQSLYRSNRYEIVRQNTL